MKPIDPKTKAIQELMAHLDSRDDEDLGAALKPQDAEVEILSVEGEAPEAGEESPGELADGSGAGPKMSDEEMEELIQAIQAKIGA